MLESRRLDDRWISRSFPPAFRRALPAPPLQQHPLQRQIKRLIKPRAQNRAQKIRHPWKPSCASPMTRDIQMSILVWGNVHAFEHVAKFRPPTGPPPMTRCFRDGFMKFSRRSKSTRFIATKNSTAPASCLSRHFGQYRCLPELHPARLP